MRVATTRVPEAVEQGRGEEVERHLPADVVLVWLSEREVVRCLDQFAKFGDAYRILPSHRGKALAF